MTRKSDRTMPCTRSSGGTSTCTISQTPERGDGQRSSIKHYAPDRRTLHTNWAVYCNVLDGYLRLGVRFRNGIGILRLDTIVHLPDHSPSGHAISATTTHDPGGVIFTFLRIKLTRRSCVCNLHSDRGRQEALCQATCSRHRSQQFAYGTPCRTIGGNR